VTRPSAAPADVALATVRSARIAVLAVQLPAAIFLILNTSTSVLGSRRADVELLPIALVVIGLQIAISLAAVRGEDPGYGLAAWLAIVACVVTLLLVVGIDDLQALWFVAAGAIVLPPRLSLVVLLATVVAFGVLASSTSSPDHTAFIFYSVVTGFAGAVGPFVATRMLRVVEALSRTLAELGLSAAGEERRRLSRDLHDALGQDLTAVALKGDLALALIGTDTAAAQRETRSLVATAERLRGELPDIVAASQSASYTVEAGRAERLLREAGIDVRRHGDPGPLPGPLDTVLGWIVREAATNVLRHSDARRWTLAAGHDGPAVWLEATNDRPRSAAGTSGSGLVGMSERLRAVGGRLRTDGGRDRFTLRVEVTG
jgi:two-component system sensor histidine kinase DesK